MRQQRCGGRRALERARRGEEVEEVVGVLGKVVPGLTGLWWSGGEKKAELGAMVAMVTELGKNELELRRRGKEGRKRGERRCVLGRGRAGGVVDWSGEHPEGSIYRRRRSVRRRGDISQQRRYFSLSRTCVSSLTELVSKRQWRCAQWRGEVVRDGCSSTAMAGTCRRGVRRLVGARRKRKRQRVGWEKISRGSILAGGAVVR